AFPLIAEALGLITPDVTALRDQSVCPACGSFSSRSTARRTTPYLPDHYVPNTVVYTGTHDNPTTRGWYAELSDTQQQNVWSWLGRSRGPAAEVAPALMGLAWRSVAALALAPIPGLLTLGHGGPHNADGP